jgi:minor extracellular serine protease Vpr
MQRFPVRPAARIALAALTLSTVSISIGLWAAPPENRPSLRGFDRRAEMRTAMENRLRKPKDNDPIVRVATKPYAIVNLEFESPAACQAACAKFGDEVYIFSRFEEFADAMVNVDTDEAANKGQNAILNAQGLVWYDIAGEAQVPPPPKLEPATVSGRGTPEQIIHGGRMGLTGKGVIVAIVDSGVDFRHPDFIRIGADGQPESRLLYFWDTMRDHVNGKGQPGPVKYPGGAPIGSVFSKADLTADLRSGSQPLGAMDLEGHGTACAGVSTGTGRLLRELAAKDQKTYAGLDYTGVAPEADIIAVRVGGRDRGIPYGWMINSIAGWLDQVGGNKPVVMSCSFGGDHGGRDGTIIEERQLARRIPANRASRLICIAAGNEGGDNLHGATAVAQDHLGKLTWDVSVPSKIELYVDVDGDADVAKDDIEVKALDDTKLQLIKKFIHPISGSLILVVQTEKGRGGLYLSTQTAKKFQADAYMTAQSSDGDTRDDKGKLLGTFTGVCAENKKQVGTPATSTDVRPPWVLGNRGNTGSLGAAFAVGSYDFNHLFLAPEGPVEFLSVENGVKKDLVIGALSRYSNAGYLRRIGAADVVKPELVAPGEYHVATRAANTSEPYLDKTCRYRYFNGTSAATPYTAGVAALLFEQRPTMAADDLRKLCRANLTRTNLTGPLPNPSWGYGKLDVTAIDKMIQSLR